MKRLVVLIVALGLIAVACSGSDSTTTDAAQADAADVDNTDTAQPDAADAEEPAENAADENTGGGDSAPVALFSPTEVDRPFDLSGGATSSDEGVEITAENARSFLRPDAANASSIWTTDWTRATVPLTEFAAGLGGTDTRDLIRPIDVPQFESIDAATQWLAPNEPGALVQFNDEARFYPLSILTRHEVLNDRFGDVPVAVTFCPLCNTALAFDRRVDGEVLRFGVSGLLRKSDLVMWDDSTDSLWQQITGEGVVGAFAGSQLDLISTAIVSFEDFTETHPDGISLSRETGFAFPYGANPYTGYSSQSGPIPRFFSDEIDTRLPALERVVAVDFGDSPVAYPFSVLANEPVVNTEVSGNPVSVFFGGSTLDALDTTIIADGAEIGSGIAYQTTVDGQVLTFTANGDDTFTDAETGTTWNLLGLALDGELEGTQLIVAPHRNEFWFAFAGFFPEAEVYGI